MDKSLRGMLNDVYEAYTEAQMLSRTQTLAGLCVVGLSQCPRLLVRGVIITSRVMWKVTTKREMGSVCVREQGFCHCVAELLWCMYHYL